MTELDYALRNLRHLYEQMLVPGRVFDTVSAATGLLGPGIEGAEWAQNRIAELEVALVEACDLAERILRRETFALDVAFKTLDTLRALVKETK